MYRNYPGNNNNDNDNSDDNPDEYEMQDMGGGGKGGQEEVEGAVGGQQQQVDRILQLSGRLRDRIANARHQSQDYLNRTQFTGGPFPPPPPIPIQEGGEEEEEEEQQQITDAIRQRLYRYRGSISSSSGQSSVAGSTSSISSVHIEPPPPHPLPPQPSARAPVCRICLTDPPLPPFHVCHCRDSMCPDCLALYIRSRESDGHPASEYLRCEICRQPYRNVQVNYGQLPISGRQFFADHFRSMLTEGRNTRGLLGCVTTGLVGSMLASLIPATRDYAYAPLAGMTVFWVMLFIWQLFRRFRRRRRTRTVMTDIDVINNRDDSYDGDDGDPGNQPDNLV